MVLDIRVVDTSASSHDPVATSRLRTDRNSYDIQGPSTGVGCRDAILIHPPLDSRPVAEYGPWRVLGGRTRGSAPQGLDTGLRAIATGLICQPAIDGGGALCFSSIDLPKHATHILRTTLHINIGLTICTPKRSSKAYPTVAS